MSLNGEEMGFHRGVWGPAATAGQGPDKEPEDVPTVPTKVSAFTNDAGYLTEHQDLSNYATLGYVDDAVAAAVAGGEINLEGYLLKADFDKVARENGYLTEIQIQSLIISYLNTFKENMPYAEELMI